MNMAGIESGPLGPPDAPVTITEADREEIYKYFRSKLNDIVRRSYYPDGGPFDTDAVSEQIDDLIAAVENLQPKIDDQSGILGSVANSLAKLKEQFKKTADALDPQKAPSDQIEIPPPLNFGGDNNVVNPLGPDGNLAPKPEIFQKISDQYSQPFYRNGRQLPSVARVPPAAPARSNMPSGRWLESAPQASDPGWLGRIGLSRSGSGQVSSQPLPLPPAPTWPHTPPARWQIPALPTLASSASQSLDRPPNALPILGLPLRLAPLGFQSPTLAAPTPGFNAWPLPGNGILSGLMPASAGRGILSGLFQDYARSLPGDGGLAGPGPVSAGASGSGNLAAGADPSWAQMLQEMWLTRLQGDSYPDDSNP